MAISNRMGGRLESLQQVTLSLIHDTVRHDSRVIGQGYYLDTDSLLTICHNLFDPVPSDRVSTCKVWWAGIITKLDRGLDR